MERVVNSLLAAAVVLSVTGTAEAETRKLGKSKLDILRDAAAYSARTVDKDGTFVRTDQYQSSKFGLNRNTFWYLLALYGLGDEESVSRANEIMDLILPKEDGATIEHRDMFTHVAAVTTYRLFADLMTESVRERARQDVVARVNGIEEHWYPTRRTNHNMGHTNYPLMFIEAFVIGSELIGDTAAQEKAYEAFNEWCDYTLHNGITEFNATTYYKVNLRCLGNLATASKDPRIRCRAAAFAEFLWLETAIHYLPPINRLVGANARTYNHFSGEGGTLGILSQVLTGRDWEISIGNHAEEVFVALHDYEPPQYIREIANEKVRTEYRGLWINPYVSDWRRGFEGDDRGNRFADGEFGHEYGKDRYTFIERAYALGTGGSHYAWQDRMLVCDIVSDKTLCSIASNINFRAPLEFEGDWVTEFIGNNRHIPTGSAEVQDKNVALITYSVRLPDSGSKPQKVRVIAPMLLLPANVDAVYVNEKPANATSGVHKITAEDVMYIQEGDVYAALRFVEAQEGFAGYKPTYHYRLDGDFRGFKVGALMCVLYNGEGKVLTEKNRRAGFVIEMSTKKEYASITDFRRHIENETEIMQSYYEGVWDVVYRTGDREMSIRNYLPADLILDKRVNGERLEPPMHETTFSRLKDGVITVTWKGQTHTIVLNP